MIIVEKSRLEAVSGFIAQACDDAMNPIQEWARLYATTTTLSVIGSGSSVMAVRNLPVVEHRDHTGLDVLVQADRLYACTKALNSGGVRIELEADGTLKISQGDALEVGLETKSASEFPVTAPFDGMKPVYAGKNPTEVFESVRHVAAAHPGNTPLAEVLIMMSSRSYLAGTLSAIRCDGSLVGAESPDVIPIRIANLWPLEKLGAELKVYHDENRVVVADDFGYVVLQKWSGDMGNFPMTVSQTFAGLRQVGQIRVGREPLLRAVTAASVILKPLTKEEVFLDCQATKETFRIEARIGRHSFKESMEAWSSGSYRIPVHISRLLSFLKNSGDEHVFIQIMDSDVIPNPKSFVHMTDSRLHEAIGIPKPREVEVLNA